MERSEVKFRAKDQALAFTGGIRRYASDTVNYVEACFDLQDNWSGFDAVTAIWNNGTTRISTVLDSNGKCRVPHEVLCKKGEVFVNLTGTTSANGTVTERLTSYPVWVLAVDAKAHTKGAETAELTPSQFEQFVTEVKADADRAETVRDEAEAARDVAVSAKDTAVNAVEGFEDIVDTATATAVQTIQGEGATQVTAIQTEGTTQVASVRTEGSTQVTAVQDKGDEVLDSIPADYTQLSQNVTDLKSDLANIITLQHSTFNGYFLLTADKVINAQNNVRIVYAEVPSDAHRISVSKTSGGVFQVGFTTVPPANGVHIIDEAGCYINATTGTSAVVNVPTTAVYIVAYVWNSVLDTTITAENMIASVNISAIRGAKDIEARTDIIQLKDDMEDLQNDKANSDGTNTDYIEVTHDGYTLEDITLTTGALDNQGVITPNTSFSITEPLYLTSNVEYTIQYKGYYDGTTEKNAPRMVCTYKADGTFSRAFAEITTITLYTDERYIIINGFTHETQLNVFKTVDGGVKNVLTAKALRIEYKNIDRAPAPLGEMSRRATISFVFDDATDGDINVKALFDSYGLRCGFALPISAVNETKVDRYLSYQNDGYEILSHSTDGTGMADPTVPVATIEAKMKSSKETLEGYGFEINGFVTPSSSILATYIPALKRWYQFGYGQISDQSGYQVNTFSGKIEGIATDRDVSQLPRCSLEASTSTVQFIKGIINTAVNNNGYVCFYGHSYPSTTNNMTEENMIEILNYLTGLQSQGQIAILPPSQAIHSFYKVRHSDYLALANA